MSLDTTALVYELFNDVSTTTIIISTDNIIIENNDQLRLITDLVQYVS